MSCFWGRRSLIISTMLWLKMLQCMALFPTRMTAFLLQIVSLKLEFITGLFHRRQLIAGCIPRVSTTKISLFRAISWIWRRFWRSLSSTSTTSMAVNQINSRKRMAESCFCCTCDQLSTARAITTLRHKLVTRNGQMSLWTIWENSIS